MSAGSGIFVQHELEYRIMEKQDIRWVQRFANYRKALHRCTVWDRPLKSLRGRMRMRQ